MKLSILDQSPLSSGHTAGQALQESMKLAQIGEKLGYTRYWIAEHHDFPGLTCSAPEVMLGYIGANTETIRIGSGAVLLPHYQPYKVAEVYHMLATLFPGRIDLGIGRAPGGSAEATLALSENYLQRVGKMPELVQELLHFMRHDFPAEHMYTKISAAPVPSLSPEPWILGTSAKSAKLAADHGTAYAFGHFMSDQDGTEIMKSYIENFKPSPKLQKAQSILAVSVICAETTRRAEQLALSGWAWKLQLAQGEGQRGVPSIEEAQQDVRFSNAGDLIKEMRNKMVIGDPQEVRQQLTDLQTMYQADEIMIVTITHSYEDRKTSYELLAQELLP